MKTVLTIKTDKSLKDMAQKVAGDIGIPLGTIINALIRQFVRNKEITLSAKHKPSSYLASSIIEAQKEFESGIVSKSHKDIKSLMEDLEA